MGNLAETAIFSQWLHSGQIMNSIYYSRWKGGEIDMVAVDPKSQQPTFALEVKWSDNIYKNSIKNISQFYIMHKEKARLTMTSKTKSEVLKIEGTKGKIYVMPSSIYAHTVGKNLTTATVQNIVNPQLNLSLEN